MEMNTLKNNVLNFGLFSETFTDTMNMLYQLYGGKQELLQAKCSATNGSITWKCADH